MICRRRRWSSFPLFCRSSIICWRTVETYMFYDWITAKNLSGVSQIYSSPCSSSRIFYTINVATVLESSIPFFIILKHRGMISVYIKKLMASASSPLTRAPITPKLVTRKFSKAFYLFDVLRKGYRNSGKCASLYWGVTLKEVWSSLRVQG